MLRVFIADDSALMRERIGDLILSVGGAELVGEAGDAPSATEAIQRLSPDVVILDIRMPGGDGLHVLERVKAGPSGPVVIVLTAFPYPQYRTRSLEAGAEYFFDKATEFDEVAHVLAGLVGHSRLAQTDRRGTAPCGREDVNTGSSAGVGRNDHLLSAYHEQKVCDRACCSRKC